VQEAILRGGWLGDHEGARAAWKHLLEETQNGGDLASLLLAMRARVALERANRAAKPSRPEPDSDPDSP
jgi:hypothetical protein